jgi:hypothetical protein
MGILSNNYAQIIPGALISASYVSDIYDVLMGTEPESIILSGSLTITGSVLSTTGFTGSLFGTSSWAVTSSYAKVATTASYAISASYINYINSSSISDLAHTASYVEVAQTASYVDLAQTASYVESASYALTASYVDLAQTASYIDLAQTASYVESASYALTASYIELAQSASYIDLAQTASYVDLAQTASYVDSTFISASVAASGFYNGVVSVTGGIVDNTDPLNPAVNVIPDGVTITGAGTDMDPLVAVSSGVQSITGLNVTGGDSSTPVINISVDGSTIYGSGTPDDPLYASIPTPAVLHTHYAFIDLVNGNDSTAALGDVTKPYATIAAAQTALIAFGVSESQPGCIYLRSGTYSSTITLKTNIITYCEPGVVFTSGGFIDDINTIKAVVLGYAQFIQNATLYSGAFATEVYIQAESLMKESGYSNRAFAIIPTNGWSNVTIEVNRCSLKCTAYDITTRGLTNLNFTCKTQVEFLYTLNNVAAVSTQYSIGKIVMTAPSWLWKANAGANRLALRVGQTTTGFVWILNGDLINESGNTGSYLLNLLQSYDSTVIFNGNIDMSVGVGAISYNSSTTKVIFNKISYSGTNQLMNLANSMQVLFDKCRITKKMGTATPSFQVAGSGQLNMVGCQFIQLDTGSVDMINVTSNTAVVNMLRTDAQATGSANYLINSNATTAVLGIKNCISNINISNVVLHKYATNNLEVESLLTLPNF